MIKTIRGKVTLWCILIVGTFNVLLSLFIYNTIHSKLEASISQSTQNIKYLARNIALLQVDLTSTDESLTQNGQIIIDGIYDYYGNYVSITLKNNEYLNRGNLLNKNALDNILVESNTKQSLLKLSHLDNTYIATYNYPIYIEDSYFGNLVIQKDYTKEYSENTKIIFFIFTFQLILLLLLVLALWFIIGKITYPIKALSKTMEDFGKGTNSDDIVVKGSDEIALLSKSFNMMKNQINNQINDIKLEQKKSREFFNNATHEIKTPITAISGYAQVLLEEDIVNMDQEFRDRALIRMVKESDKLSKLAKNILDISKGTMILSQEKQSFDLGQLLQNKINEMQIRLSKSNLTINSNIENITVNMVKDDISTIITNLLDNAIKYSSGNVIEITLSQKDALGELKISNKILELPEDIKNKLLEPFIKYSNDEVLQKEGITSSGLGLYLCHGLATKSSGSLGYIIENEIITFSLLLPM